MPGTKRFSVLGLGLVFGIMAMQACSKGDTKLDYNLPMQTGSIEVVIPPTPDTTNVKDLGSGANYFNVDSFIRANTKNLLGISNIQSVRLTSVKLALKNATTANNFANLYTYYASFYTNSNTTPYKVAPTEVNKDEFSVSKDVPVDPNAELKGYLNGNQFTYSVGGKLRRPTTDTLKCTIEFKFDVSVQG
jgi:hypothetical protein